MSGLEDGIDAELELPARKRARRVADDAAGEDLKMPFAFSG